MDIYKKLLDCQAQLAVIAKEQSEISAMISDIMGEIEKVGEENFKIEVQATVVAKEE